MQSLILEPQYAQDYRALMLRAYTEEADAFVSSAAERSALPETWWQARLSESHRQQETIFGGFIGNQLVGSVGLSFESRDKKQHLAKLIGMYVLPSFRSSGIARSLVESALDLARNTPRIKVVQLTVTDGNVGAQKLYERYGFVTFGIEPFAMREGDRFFEKRHMYCLIR